MSHKQPDLATSIGHFAIYMCQVRVKRTAGRYLFDFSALEWAFQQIVMVVVIIFTAC